MAGILDKKERIQDYVITNNGRKQIQNGDIRFFYASFTDQNVLYHSDDKKISKTKEDYIGFEANTKLNDEINPEFSLSDFLNYNIELNRDLYVENGRLFHDSNTTISDAILKITSESFLEGKLNDLKFLDRRKPLNRNGIKFTNPNINEENVLRINNSNYPTYLKKSINLKTFPSLPFDKRFSEKLNYKKLIPRNSEGLDLFGEKETQKRFLEDINQSFATAGYKNQINFAEIDNRDDAVLTTINNMMENIGIAKKVYEVNNFDYNDIYLFSLYESLEEENNPEIFKLSFIDLGEIYDKKNQKYKQIYLIGKIIRSRNEYEEIDIIFELKNSFLNKEINKKPIILSAYYSFICMFTLVIE